MGFGGFDVGSIVGHLVLDKEQWRQAVTSVQGDLKDLKKSIKLKSDEIQAAGRILATFGASVTASFGLLLKSSADAGDQINELSKSTGISTELLSGYKLAADKSGTSIEGFAVGMKTLANGMQAAITQGGASKRMFNSLGVSFKDNEGKLRPLDQVMLDVADRFKAMPGGAEKSALAVDLFGRSGQQLIPMLNLGRQGLEAQYAAAERLGLVFSKEAAQGADDFNDSLVDLQGAVKGVGNELAKSLLPALKPLIDRTTNTINLTRQFVKEYPALATSLAEIVVVSSAIAGVIGTVGLMLTPFQKGWKAISMVLQAAAEPILIIGAAWAGYQFGKWIGDVTGLNKTYQSLFDSLFRGLGIIKEVNIEFGAGHAASYAIQTEAIGRATELSGKKVSGFIEAQRILRRQFQETGTVGNATLDAWLAKLPPLKEKTGDLEDGLGDLRIMVKKLEAPIIDAVAAFEKMGSVSLDALISDLERLDFFGGIHEVPIELDLDKLGPQKEEAVGILQEFIDAGAAASKAAGDEAKAVLAAHEGLYTQVFGDIINGFTSIMDGSKTMGQFFSSIVTTMIADLGKLVIAEMLFAKGSIMRAQMESVAHFISSIFKKIPFPLNIALAAGAFGLVSALFKKLLKFEGGGVFTKPTIAEVGHGTEYVLPEKKLIRIVQDAMQGSPGGGSLSPQLAFAGAGLAPSINLYINSPLINAHGYSRRDIDEAGDYILEVIERKAHGRGWELKHA